MSKKLFTKSLSALLSAVMSVEFGVFNCPQEAFAIDTTSSYAVYSDGDIIVNTSRGVINGNVYTGDDFKYLGNNTCYVNKNLNAEHVSDNVQALSNNESRAEKPDYRDFLKKRVNYGDVRSEDTSLKGGSLELDGSVNVKGSLNIDRTVFSGKGYLTADGNIKYNAVQNADGTEMFLTSNNGNITIQGTDLVMKGVIYAPEGKVEINAKHFIFNGTIIAEKVEINGTDVTINELNSDDNTLLQFGPELNVKGIEETYKENRKITLDIAESFGISDVDIDSLSWEFSPVSGNNYDAVKTDNTSSTVLHQELIISKAGDYKVIITGKDKSGEPFKYTDNLKVIEDIAPVADFTKEFDVTGRDGEGTASIKLTDNSYSLDGDEIGSRVWSVFFDNDNDGDFTDEKEDIFSTGNETEVIYDAKSVGKYKFELHSAEVFTDTIRSLLSEDAYRVSGTSDREKKDSVIEVTNEAPESKSGISLAKNVDIVITAGNVDIDEINTINNNVNEIKNELEEKGYNVNLDTMSTSTLTAKDTFAWQEYDHYKYEDRHLPTLDKHIIYKEDSIQMLGYSWAPLRDWLFVDDGISAKRVLSFDMVRDRTDWHSMEGGGFLFNTSIKKEKVISEDPEAEPKTVEKLNGYCIILTSGGFRLVQLTDIDVEEFRNGGISGSVQGAGKVLTSVGVNDAYADYNVKIVANSRVVSVYINDEKLIDNFILPDDETGNGFGPIICHGGHNCGQQSYFTFSNIKMSTVRGSELSDILDDHEWRKSSERFVVNLSPESIYDLNEDAGVGHAVKSLIENDAHFIGIGTVDSKDEYDSILKTADGEYIDWYDLLKDKELLKKYIFKVLGEKDYTVKSNMVTTDDEIVYDNCYVDKENDPVGDQHWTYELDASAYENSSKESGVWTENKPLTFLPATGIYKITSKLMDDPTHENKNLDSYKKWSNEVKWTDGLYVHSRPVAEIKSKVMQADESSKYICELSFDAYDNDSLSKDDKGIAEEVKEWKRVSDSGWTKGTVPKIIEAGDVFLQKYAVRDTQGEWSKTAVELIYVEKTENSDMFKDEKEPELTLDVSDKNPCLNDQIMISASATDDTEVTSVIIYVNDKVIANYAGSVLYDCKSTGVLTVKAVCEDLGHNKTEKVIEVNVEDRRDLTPPEITIDTKKDIVINDGKVEVNGTIKDDVKLDTYTVELQAPGESEFKSILTSSDEVNNGLIASFDTNGNPGKYLLKITAADTSGNKRYDQLTLDVSEDEKYKANQNSKTEKPAAQKREDSPTEISITPSPETAEIGEVVSVAIDAKDIDGLKAVKIYKDNKQVGEGIGEFRFSEYEPKTVTIKVEATDANGKKTTATKEVVFTDTADRTAPVAEIKTPEAGSQISGKVSVTGSAYDETGLRSFKLEYKRADENAYKLITSSLSDRHEAELGVLDTYPLDNTVYDIRLTATDNGGNTQVCSVQYQVKNGAETTEEQIAQDILVFTKPDPSVTADNVIKVEAKADPSLSDKEYEVILKKADGTGSQQTIKNGKIDGSGNISASADSSMLDDGDYTVTVAVKVPDGTSVKKDINVKVKHDYVKAAEDVICTIVSPDYNAEISAPTEIKAEVTENKFSRYKFEYSPAGMNEYTIFEKGSVSGKEITGKLDPTLLENGFYDIRITAYGDKITAEDTVTVELTGNMKIGNFTLSFADLEFEAQGIPVTMIRTYDSRNKDKNGEFGYGWDLSYNTVKLDINSDQSENWTEEMTSSFFVAQFEIKETKQHKIKIDLSNGVTDEFVMSLSPAKQVLIPQHYGLSVNYISTTGSGATLVPCDMSANDLFYDSGVLLNSEFNYFNPQRFVYTRPDGTEYTIDSKLGLMSIKSSDGNVISLNKNGVSSTDGKSIKFVYDKEDRIIEASDNTGKKLTYEYDVFGDLVSVKDQADRTTSFVYKNHYITEIYDSRGVMLSKNEYDDDGRLVKTTDSDGNEIVYDHDIDGREESITDRNGGITRYIYDDNGNILSQTDANGNTIKNTYDSNGNPATKTDAMGNVTSYQYDAMGNMLSLSDAEGHTVTNEYDSKGQLTSINTAGLTALKIEYTEDGLTSSTTDAMGNKISYDYDSQKRLKSVTDEIGTYMNMTYDSNGNVKTATNGAGATAEFTYDAKGNCLSKTVNYTSDGTVKTVTESYVYDDSDHLIKTIDTNGNIVSNEYNSIDKISVATDEKGRQTSYDYDKMGNLIKISYFDGTCETFTYDKEGRNLTATDRNGRTVTMTYDKVGNLLTKTYPNGKTVEYNYDANYRLISTKDIRGAVTAYEYDKVGNNTAVIDALGNKTSFAYNDRAQLESMTDARGNNFLYSYDDNGNRIKTTYPDGSSVSSVYDARRRVTSQTDQHGYTTNYTYDGADNLTSVTDAMGGTTTYEYDELNNLVKVTDANGNATQYTYDEFGRVIKTTNALGLTATATYDISGNILTSTDYAGKVTEFKYDNNDRLSSKTNDDGTISYSYTRDGKLANVNSPAGRTYYEYNNTDGLTKVTYPDGSFIQYNYDENDVLTSINTSSGTTTYDYDLLGRLVRVVDRNGFATEYEYDSNGNRTAVKYANGIVVTYDYDALNRLISEKAIDKDGGLIVQYEYTLGEAGERIRITEHGHTVEKAYNEIYLPQLESVFGDVVESKNPDELSRTVEYTYDELYRLTGEKITNADGGVNEYTYTYDAVSNRLSKNEDGSETNYSYNALNQLVSENNTVYTYDDAGNLISTESADKSSTYVYNASNKLLRATVQAGEEVIVEEYTYNYDGSRLSKKTTKGEETSIVEYFNDDEELTNVLAEYDNDGNELCCYTIGDDLISMERGGSTYIYLYDGHGTVRGLIDADGNLTDIYNYDAFGNMLEKTGETENSYLYCGEQHDYTTSLYYLRARYMNPETGTFTSMDTYQGYVFDPVSIHKYLYANADPVTYSDPSGYMAYAAELKYDLGIMKIGMELIATLKGLIIAAANTMMGILTAEVVESILVGGIATLLFCAEVLMLEMLLSVSKDVITYVEGLSVIDMEKEADNIKNKKYVYVYLLREQQTEQVKYVGISDDPIRRETQHKADPKKYTDNLHWRMDVILKVKTRIQARMIEQVLISAYGIANIANARNEIRTGRVASETKFNKELKAVAQVLDNITEENLMWFYS